MEWTDVDKDMPKAGHGQYLVTTAEDDVTMALYTPQHGWLVPSGFNGDWRVVNVIAWAKKPEPYRRRKKDAAKV